MPTALHILLVVTLVLAAYTALVVVAAVGGVLRAWEALAGVLDG